MENNSKKLRRYLPIISLALIALCSGLILAIVNHFTAPSKDELDAATLAKLTEIYDADYSKVDFKLNNNVSGFYKAEDENYFILISKGSGRNGDIQVFVSIRDKAVVDINIGENTETAGYIDNDMGGDKKSKYLLPIDSNFKVTKDGGEIDYVANATETPRGISQAISSAVEIYKSYLISVEDISYLPMVNEVYSANYIDLTDTVSAKNANRLLGFYKIEGEENYVVASRVKGMYEGLEVFIKIEDGAITDFHVYANKETPRNFAILMEEANQDNFIINLNLNLALKVNGGDIDNVAGATQSANGIVDAANIALKVYNEHKNISYPVVEKLREINDIDYINLDISKFSITETVIGFYKGTHSEYYVGVMSVKGLKTGMQVYVSIENKKIVNIAIGENSETPEYLERALSQENIDKLLVAITTDFSKVDISTGATMTSNGIVNAVKETIALFNQYEEKVLQAKIAAIFNTEYTEISKGDLPSYTTDKNVLRMFKANNEDYFVSLVRISGTSNALVAVRNNAVVDFDVL